MRPEDVVRHAFEAFNANDFTRLEAMVDPEVEFSPELMRLEGATFHGYEGLRTFDRLRREVFDSIEVEFGDLRAGTDIAVALGRIRVRGRASGIEVDRPIVWICRFRGGRLRALLARRADDPGEIARALDEAGLPHDAFGEAASGE